jgi:cytochrome P450
MSVMTAEPFRPYAPTPRPTPASLAELVWLSWRDPLAVWSERHFTEPVLWGESRLGHAMTVSDPAGIRRVLLDNAANYDKGRVQKRVLGRLIGDGLLLVEGEAWRRARRTLAPLFAPRRLATTVRRMDAISSARADAWLAKGDDALVLVDREMTRVTFEILSATLFSDELGGDLAGFEQALLRFSQTAARVDPLDVVGAPSWLPRVGRIMGEPALRYFEEMVAGLVSARRALLSGGEAPDDLTSALIRAQDPETGVGLSDREVAANILTFILAGHETTARTLGWTLHLLSHAPDVADRVAAEGRALDLSDPGWMETAPWTRAVLEEAMRLFPPAPLLTREALGEDEVSGVKVRKGTQVLISPWVLHRHALLWEDPSAFRPERFLPGAREGIDRFAYIPFGAGPRICIGASFAMQEAVLILSAIIRRLRLAPGDAEEPRPSQRITLRSEKGIRLRVSRR